MLNILLPLDGSELAERALPHALAMAASVSASVTLLRIVTPSEFRPDDVFSRVDWRLGKQQAETYLQGVSKSLTIAGVSHELLVEDGQPADVIMEVARRINANLLIMSSHGRGAAIDFPRGGVASKVLSTFDASVLLVGARTAIGSNETARYERILVPIDGSYQTDCALRVAIVLAESSGAELSVVCVSEMPEVPSIAGRNERARELCHELADVTRMAAERKLASVRARTPENIDLRTSVMLTGKFENPIIKIAREFEPDLLVTGIAATDELEGPFASLAQVTSAEVDAPLLVVNPNGIGSAFCESRDAESPDVRTADVS